MSHNSLCVLLCDSFKAEVDAIAATGSYRDVTFATYPARCGRPPLQWEEIRQLTPHTSQVALIGSCCLSELGADLRPGCAHTSLDSCFRLFISGYAVDKYLSEGAYLVTAGWLSSWRCHVDGWGFDRDGAREFFRESCRKILFLDSGVCGDSHSELEEFSRYVALPYEVVPAGLDLMISYIERSIGQWRRQRKAKHVSEYAMVVDLLGSITTMVDEEEVVRGMLQFYTILFGATDVAYVVMADGKPAKVIHPHRSRGGDDAQLMEQAAALDGDHLLLESQRGFLIAIRHEGKTVGVARAAGIALPQYRDQYLNLALSTAGVWELAITNARSFNRISEITRELEGQKRLLEGINRIFDEALSTRTEEEVGQTCLAVAEELTGSGFGFLGEIGADGLLHAIAISNPGWEACTMYDHSGHRKPPGQFKIHGLYGSVLASGRSLLSNDPARDRESVGLPAGHPPLNAFLGVPLAEEGRVIGMIALGNRPGGYRQEELEVVEALAPAVVAALRRKHAEEALLQANELLEERVAQRTAELADRETRRRAAERLLHEETVERLRISETLREKERLLIQQSRLAALGEMINNIAHQWRQPLNSMGLIIQELQMDFELGALEQETLDDRVKKVMELLGHMSRTIDDFRNFFKADKEKVAFKLADVVTQTLSLVEESFRMLRINVRVHSEGNPEVMGYPNEYAQVLLNILLNARDAFAEKESDHSRSVTITMTQEEKGVVTITDNAGGIPEEIIAKIFDPYFTTKGPEKGTGVGLYMAKTIIEKNMEGKLSVHNVANGAEFRIEV